MTFQTPATEALDPSGKLRRAKRFRVENITRIAVHVGFLAAIIAAWHALVASGIVLEVLLPRPATVAEGLWASILSIISGGAMWAHVKATLTAVGIGLAIAILAGIVLGALISEFRVVRMLLMPYVIAFNSTPRIAIAPMTLVWFGFGVSSKAALAALTAMFPVLIATIAGLSASDRNALRLLRGYGATRWQIFRKLRMFDALPYLFAGLELAAILSVIGTVVGEFTGGSEGLGFAIIVAQASLDLSAAFAALLLLSFIGTALHRITIMARERVVYWRPGADESTSAPR